MHDIQTRRLFHGVIGLADHPSWGIPAEVQSEIRDCRADCRNSPEGLQPCRVSMRELISETRRRLSPFRKMIDASGLVSLDFKLNPQSSNRPGTRNPVLSAPAGSNGRACRNSSSWVLLLFLVSARCILLQEAVRLNSLWCIPGLHFLLGCIRTGGHPRR
ncbi:hypothetical protein BO94DRAFT_305700 [Aspergillus sclerotioniger CBS 115572]|uniref:Uncharacterized protein n=1 Tax=Aspergillus sclerotioniger CBS 115572 TaxID=1450535 RepID=A0A317V585_9EURO|nr:hypothetical protein BO94DRAFT_305700 [Aspergillus sclerotioniger CBS 115572]PWY68012.1 hypothetical protein BO94DRAFT_305700 [Aspergillus sclerotioniger CBS 115572]